MSQFQSSRLLSKHSASNCMTAAGNLCICSHALVANLRAKGARAHTRARARTHTHTHTHTRAEDVLLNCRIADGPPLQTPIWNPRRYRQVRPALCEEGHNGHHMAGGRHCDAARRPTAVHVTKCHRFGSICSHLWDNTPSNCRRHVARAAHGPLPSAKAWMKMQRV